MFVLCVFYTVTDFSADDKVTASNIARRFIGVEGMESHIFGNFAPQSQKSDESRVARALANSSDRDATFAACGRRIGMCGYMAVPKDGRTC